MDAFKAAAGAFALLLALFMLGLLYLSSENASLEKSLAALKSSSSQQLLQSQSDYALLSSSYGISQRELAGARASLDKAEGDLSRLQRELRQTAQALNASRESLASQAQMADELAANFTALESSINSSMSWFRENARMPSNYSWAGDIFMKRAMEDCVDQGSLNLACISHLMENTAFAIHYRQDTVSGSFDHLQGVKETIDLGWGDCEDYSLIFKAILNSVRGQNSSISFLAWRPAASGEFRIYPKETPGSTEPYWAYQNAQAVQLGTLANAYVICYSVDAASGHCTVALSGALVNGSSQVLQLQGSEVFEPQSGRYLGKIGESLSICTDSSCRQSFGKIWLVISDSDLYVYGQGGWQGYADYLSRVQSARASLTSP
jgi:hypothetical protein